MMELYVNLNPESKSPTLISRASETELNCAKSYYTIRKTKHYQMNLTSLSFN